MAKKNKKKKKNNKGFGFKAILLLFILLICMIMFLPSTFLLLIGMLPTAVFYFIDKSEGKNKTFTIGAMNFTGCFPYLLGVWRHSGSMDTALAYLQDPLTIVVIYGAAASGHLIDWIVKIIVTNILIEKAKHRLQKIEKLKSKLTDRWGKGVQGTKELDKEDALDNKADQKAPA